jgi:hypothetical protein
MLVGVRVNIEGFGLWYDVRSLRCYFVVGFLSFQ